MDLYTVIATLFHFAVCFFPTLSKHSDSIFWRLCQSGYWVPIWHFHRCTYDSFNISFLSNSKQLRAQRSLCGVRIVFLKCITLHLFTLNCVCCF